MPFSGEGLRKVLVVAERDWHLSHFMLERLINRSGGLDRSYFYFCSLADAYSIPALVKKHDIKVIVGLGEPVLNRLMGEKDILRWRGRPLPYGEGWFIGTFAHHRLLPENPNAASFQPGALTNPPRFQGVWMLDMEFAVHVAKHGFVRKPGNYIVDPTPAEFEKWALAAEARLHANPLAFRMSYDIETAYKQKKRNEDEYDESEALADGTLLRLSFTDEEYTGVSVPAAGPYLGICRGILGSDAVKVGWNCLGFDNPILENNDLPVRGMVYDGMDMFHLYQSDLPRGLEWATSFTSDMLPWKHLNNSDPGLYSAIDPDAAIRNTNWLEVKLRKTGQWTTFLNHYARLMPVMGTAGKRGNFIDIPKRDELRTEMNIELAAKVAEIQPMVPLEIKPRKRYKRRPEELVRRDGVFIIPEQGGEAERLFEAVPVELPVKYCTFCSEEGVTQKHFASVKGAQKVDKKGNLRFDKNGEPMLESVKSPCKTMGAEIKLRQGWVTEWDEVLPFNPNSSDQLKAYARHFGHPLGESMNGTGETMDAGHLKVLAKDYKKDHGEFYSRVMAIKKLTKTLGTYIYTPDAENLIHTTYSNAPSTPRFSSRNVNLQNVGKREDNYWATRAREQIIARPGHRFVQADSSAIEALVQGWWMDDPIYMQLATQSVHAWVVAQHHGIPWVGDEEQVSFLKANYHDDYNKMKTTNYLTNFGGGPYLLYKSFPDVFPTKQSAEDAQNTLYAMLPKLKEFHHWVRTKAQKESYLELPGWKHRHYFYDVFTVDPGTGKVKYGRDAKRVCAFFPQGCAASFMRDNSLLLAHGDRAAEWLGIEPLGLGEGYLRWFPANFVVHDGYTLEVPDGKEDEAAEALEKVLTRPIPQLANLRVGAEVDISPVGGNWSPYHEKKNPQGLVTVKTIRVPVVAPPADIRRAA